MHRKFCIIDNHVVITGSYNWTKNAAERNDENIMIVQDWAMANQHTREFMDIWNSNDK
jgi:phosphatidylserine/phosphatidylglycerophosphate/cardiolipin synthase-like enzyme